MQKQTWLVTGASSGLGLSITLAALRNGHRVIATARNVSRALQEHPEVENMGGSWLQLDVTWPNTQELVSEAIEKEGGKLDVVVNNAGTMLLTSLEDANLDVASEMVNTHVFGAMRVLKGVLPSFRAQKHGTIVNMSSFSGFLGVAGNGLYTLCKFALEGITEVYQAELSTFNIRVILLEPGAFRTSIMQKSAPASDSIGLHYLNSAVGETIEITHRMAAKLEEEVAGDPDRLGQRVVDLVDVKNSMERLQGLLRVPLGSDAAHLIEGKVKNIVNEFEIAKPFATGTDFPGHSLSKAAKLH